MSEKKIKTIESGPEPIEARKALKVINDAIQPFVKLFSKNTGNARIAISFEYIERGRPAYTPPEPTVHLDAVKELFTPKDVPFGHIFRPALDAVVRHTTDLPCPRCGVAAQTKCVLSGDRESEFQIVCNGVYTLEAKIFVHRERITLFQHYVALMSMGG